MPKIAKEKGPLAVSRMTGDGYHAVGGVAGLHLQISGKARSWILRTTVGEKIRKGRDGSEKKVPNRKDIGLGSYPEISLAEARQRAKSVKDEIRKGVDPILAKKATRAALQAAQASAITFAEATRKFLDAKGDEWRSAKHRAQWKSTLDTYAKSLANMHVADIRKEHVLHLLEPIWKDVTETATRVRQRIEKILDWAAVRGYRTGENPARWKGNLDHLLPTPGKIAPIEHHRAIPIGDMGQFMHDLREREGTSARALEFAALTAARSGEARGATWAEIDLNAGIWTVPGAKMKARKEHRVPLSKAAVKLLESIKPEHAKGLVFPGTAGKPLSDMSLTAVMRRMKVDAVPHGLRSTFRDWAAERTAYPREIAEMALAHTIANKTEAAYRRGDVLAKRRRMMEEWATFCGRIEAKQGNVLAIKQSA